MDSGEDESLSALTSVGDDLRDCETPSAVARTAVDGLYEHLDAEAAALATGDDLAATAGPVPAGDALPSVDEPTTVAVAAGPADRAAVAPVADRGTLWLWTSEAPAPAVAAAAADRVGAALDRTAAERDRAYAAERIETVASVVNHDLSNPLTIADGYLEVVAREVDSEHLAAVEAAVDRIDGVATAAVTLARAGRPVDDPGPVPVASLAREAWRAVGDDAATLSVDDGTLAADPERLLELFERLFDNAVVHGGADRVRVAATERGLVIADDGCGIAPDRRERATEAGYSTADGRAGLGLTVAEWLARAHGWSLALDESEEGGLAVSLEGAVTEPSA